MRQRTTWNRDRQAATSRTADDIYDMNQEHKQPSATEYENGDPNSWAETPTKNEYIKQSYDGDSEARNEVGFGEFVPSTFDHKDSKEWGGSGKYDNQRGGMTASTQKAASAERIARAILRTANTELIEQQSVDFMSLPDTVLVATLKRLDAVSPNALPKEAKLRRSYACCKLAAAMIPAKEAYATEGVWENFVQTLGSTLMSLDDQTLKTLIKTSVAAGQAVVAKEEEEDDGETASVAPVSAKKEDEKDEKVSSAKKDEEKDEKVSAAKKDEEKDEKVSSADKDEPEVDVSCMSDGDMQMLDSMLAPAVPAAPLAPPMGAPAPLTDLFAEAAPASPGLPGLASEMLDIEFDGGDDEPRVASDASDLDSVFSDHEEVQAQREIRAAHQEQTSRESGFQPASLTRTASDAGAKKLGTVRRVAAETKDELESLWA